MLDPKDFSFSTHPNEYKHITLKVTQERAQITIAVNPEANLCRDTPLKLNSYDLSVDIELNDAIMRLRFEYPEVKVVIITSAHPQVFCSGANIYMLKKSSHAFKVNFCKYTNETRLYLEEASRFSGLKSIAALNGTAAGGGYELALACDRILLLDDKAANVSLPEVPLLGVLPGTGGLTRLVDKRGIRRDLADIFCTTAEGFKGEKAKNFGLVDQVYTKSIWEEAITEEALLLQNHIKKSAGPGIKLDIINPEIKAQEISYEYVKIIISDQRTATITMSAPRKPEPTQVEAMLERGQDLWLLKAFRELDDAIVRLRFFHRDVGLWELRVDGDVKLILNAEACLYNAMSPQANWFLREIVLHIGRVYKRLDTSARSMVCLLDEPQAWAGVFAEMLFIADRTYAKENSDASIILSPLNAGMLAGWNGLARLQSRFLGHEIKLKEIRTVCNTTKLTLSDAYKLGLITYLLDDLDYSDEVRVFLEERASLSPDALSAMEANLRFNGPESLATKIFGRLSAWQNWVFLRDNATGPQGALSSYGEEKRANFDFERC